jgi:hypothetical protein
MASVKGFLKNEASWLFNRTIGRLWGAGISTDSRIVRSTAKWSGRNDKQDWRVKLTIPSGSPMEEYFFAKGSNELLKPLYGMKGIFWPLTPTMIIQHSANYNPLAQTHSNYPFQAYQNSQVDQMNIIGEFPVQNQQDAAYWVATVNFLRTVTKMFFGKDDELKGNPPPILHLSAYGDHMFDKVPVVINTFNVELRAGIDYISTRQDTVYSKKANAFHNVHKDQFDPNAMDQTWAPTLSNISVLVTPIYSREAIKNFNLREFALGKLRGKDRIGFI